MKTHEMSMSEVRTAGYRALVKELGLVNAIRFMRDMSPGTGDYTKERESLLPDKTIDEIVKDMDLLRQSGEL